MQLTQTTIINIVTVLGVVSLAWYLKTRWRAVMSQVKEHLFTVHGFVVAVVWSVLAVGLISCLMFVRISSGDSMSLSYPTEQGIQEAIKGKGK